MKPITQPTDLTELDRTRDLALAHLVERLADGEIRPEELEEAQAQVALMPMGSQRVEFERMLRAACARAMGSIEIPPDAKDRVLEAARLRLRGEAEGMHLALETLAGSVEIQADRIPIAGRTLSFGKLAAAAVLVLTGFFGARLTMDLGDTGSTHDLAGGGSASAGIDFSRTSSRSDEYYARAVESATQILGERPHLATVPGMIPATFTLSQSTEGRPAVHFSYSIEIPNAKGKTQRWIVRLVVETDPAIGATSDAVTERSEGDAYWKQRREGRLLYNIFSDSKQALDLVTQSLGWPESAPKSRAR